MTARSLSPLKPLGVDALVVVARAAGFAAACEFESSQQFHQSAIADRRRSRLGNVMAGVPSPYAVLLSLVLIVL